VSDSDERASSRETLTDWDLSTGVAAPERPSKARPHARNVSHLFKSQSWRPTFFGVAFPRAA